MKERNVSCKFFRYMGGGIQISREFLLIDFLMPLSCVLLGTCCGHVWSYISKELQDFRWHYQPAVGSGGGEKGNRYLASKVRPLASFSQSESNEKMCNDYVFELCSPVSCISNCEVIWGIVSHWITSSEKSYLGLYYHL